MDMYACPTVWPLQKARPDLYAAWVWDHENGGVSVGCLGLQLARLCVRWLSLPIITRSILCAASLCWATGLPSGVGWPFMRFCHPHKWALSTVASLGHNTGLVMSAWLAS